MSGENWNAIMYDCWRGTSWAAALYFVLLVIIGIFLIMNLFLAILLNNFADIAEKPEAKLADADDRHAVEGGSATGGGGGGPDAPDAGGEAGVVDEANNRLRKLGGREGDAVITGWDGKDLLVPRGRVLCVFGETNGLRHLLVRIVKYPAFDNFILFAIFVSCVCLVIDSPLQDPKAPIKVWVGRVDDYGLLPIFIAEMGLKILALGLACEARGTYLKDGWNVMDGVVVVGACVERWGGNAVPLDLSMIRALRAMRAMRPLRALHRFPGIKTVVETMLSSLPDVANTVIVCLVFFMIFAIFAVNFLKGEYRACQGDDFDAIVDGTEYGDFLSRPKKWTELDNRCRNRG